MPSTSDVRSYSTRILGNLQLLDALLDDVARSGLSAGEISDITDRTRGILDSLTATRSDLLAAIEHEPATSADPRRARRGIAVARAELPLEPALEALRQLPSLIEKASAQGATSAVVLVPLVLAYRHTLDALRPLAEAVDPSDLRIDAGPARA